MVGVHVILDIAPQHIDGAAWAEAFEETRRLVEAHPARLVGYGFRMVAGIRVPVFTRSVVQGGQDPAERRWCVVGDRATLWSGERQRMYRDVGRYAVRRQGGSSRGRPPPSARDALPSVEPGALRGVEPPVEDDILLAAEAAPSEPSGTVRVFGEGEQSEPCRLALLAAAIVVETRFPKHAMVSGTFDREQAEAARRWAQGILGKTLALPVRADAFRLVERLGARLGGEALVRAVDRLYLGEPGARAAALLAVFGRAEAEPWFLARLRDHASPDAEGARRLLAAYLDATRDPARLTTLACLDARGPGWPAEAFVGAIASLSDARGGRPRFDSSALDRAVAAAFGPDAPRLAESQRARSADPLPSIPDAVRAEPCVARLAALRSPGELDAVDRDCVLRLVQSVRESRNEDLDAMPPLEARRTIAALLAVGGPTLTEDAWDWIDREEDTETCRFLAGLCRLDPPDGDQADLRRALLENRTLCRYAARLPVPGPGRAMLDG